MSLKLFQVNIKCPLNSKYGHHILMFWATMDHIYDGGPEKITSPSNINFFLLGEKGKRR
jgi:hypothetical protein